MIDPLEISRRIASFNSNRLRPKPRPNFTLDWKKPRSGPGSNGRLPSRGGILLRMHLENLLGALGTILIFQRAFAGSTERSIPF